MHKDISMNANTKHPAASAAALAGYSIFGFSFLATRVASTVATPFMLLAFRYLTALLVLTLLLPVFRVRLHFKKRGAWRLLLLGVSQPVLYAIAETYGIGMIGSAVSGSIISTSAVVSFLLAVIFLKEKFKLRQFLFAAGSVVGVCMLTLPGAAAGSVKPLGVLLILGAVLCTSVYNILTKELSDDFTAFERTFAMFAVGTVSFTLLSFIEHGKETLSLAAKCLESRQFIFCILYLAVCSSVAAFLMLNYAYKLLTVKQTAAFTSVTSVVSALVGAIAGEPLVPLQFCGIAVILVCVYKVAAGGDSET